MNPGSPGPSSSKIPKFLRTSSSNSRPKSVEKSKVSRRSITMDPEETPIVIVEPIPRSPPSPTRISDLPSRLSGWFSHTFSSSTTDLSLPNILASSTSTSPKRNPGANALLTAAKHGKGHLDKAMRYILDSDAAPDKCTDPIWILGVKHPGYDPPSSLSSSTRSLRSSVSSNSDLTIQAQASKNPQWPVEFYADFTSRVWLTYRSHFPPIRDIRLADLESDPTTDFWKKSSRDDDNFIAPSPSVSRRSWAWGGEKGWTSDSGWGCMLRTGQSLLANALIHHHLGRDWRRPPHPIHTADYAKYVEIVSWFLDTPAPEAPFSVHRMALAGKELGTDVGQWFGPSTAAGAIKTLVNSFPTSDLGVAVATDGVLFQTEVFSASHLDSSRSVRSPRRHQKTLAKTWGERPVLVLVGVRLGIEGVNPVYYDTIKMLYTFPQSVGIAGGRPSSSYYFVGSQADNLFYLDPHHARSAIALRQAPQSHDSESDPTLQTYAGHEYGHSHAKRNNQRSPPPNRASTNSPSSIRTGSSTFSPSPLQQEFSTSSESSSAAPSTASTSGSIFIEEQNPRPVLHVKAHSTTTPTTSASASRSSSIKHPHPSRFRSASVSVGASSSVSPSTSEVLHESDLRSSTASISEHLDPIQEHYVTSYPAMELKTFHCDRVRKMPLSGLDPSMLIGFLCKDEADWEDFRRRVGELPRTVFSIQEEPPTWPSDFDDEMGLESISEPDPDDLLIAMDDDDDEEEDNDDDHGDDREDGQDDDEDDDREQFVYASVSTSGASASASESTSGSGSSNRRRATSEEVDTEEDPVDPITPLPNSKFTIVHPPPGTHDGDGEEIKRDMFEDDIEDDWIDPSLPTPIPSNPRPIPIPRVPVSPSPSASASSSSSRLPTSASASSYHAKGSTSQQKSRRKKEIPVPVPLVKVPTPSLSRASSQNQGQQQQQLPFPVSQRSADDSTTPTRAEYEHRLRHTSIKASGKRMHTARARDGGRTQSGGVKGILTDG